MKRVFIAALLILLSGAACDGNKSSMFNEVELVSFSVSGTATCKSCDAKRITALQVEIVPKDDPVTTLSMNVFDGPGPFHFSDLRYGEGADLNVYGRIYYGTGESSLNASTEIEVPGDGETVSCVLNF